MHAYLKPLIDPTHSSSSRVSKKPLMQERLNNSDFNSHSTLIDHQREEGGGARICIGQIHYAKNFTL